VKKSDRFWITFGKCIALGVLGAILIGLLEFFSPADTAQFLWVKPFGLLGFFGTLGVTTFLTGLVGIALGIGAANDEANGLKVGDFPF